MEISHLNKCINVRSSIIKTNVSVTNFDTGKSGYLLTLRSAHHVTETRLLTVTIVVC